MGPRRAARPRGPGRPGRTCPAGDPLPGTGVTAVDWCAWGISLPPGRGHLVAVTSRTGVHRTGRLRRRDDRGATNRPVAAGPGGIDVSASTLLEVLGYGAMTGPVLGSRQAAEPALQILPPDSQWGLGFLVSSLGDRARGERYDRPAASSN